MACSLIRPDFPLSERFDHVMNTLKELSGSESWGFSNSVYLSEKETADANFCLAYMMRGKGAFPSGANIQQTLEFYFQCCSMETDCNSVSIAGATIANG